MQRKQDTEKQEIFYVPVPNKATLGRITSGTHRKKVIKYHKISNDPELAWVKIMRIRTNEDGAADDGFEVYADVLMPNSTRWQSFGHSNYDDDIIVFESVFTDKSGQVWQEKREQTRFFSHASVPRVAFVWIEHEKVSSRQTVSSLAKDVSFSKWFAEGKPQTVAILKSNWSLPILSEDELPIEANILHRTLKQIRIQRNLKFCPVQTAQLAPLENPANHELMDFDDTKLFLSLPYGLVLYVLEFQHYWNTDIELDENFDLSSIAGRFKRDPARQIYPLFGGVCVVGFDDAPIIRDSCRIAGWMMTKATSISVKGEAAARLLLRFSAWKKQQPQLAHRQRQGLQVFEDDSQTLLTLKDDQSLLDKIFRVWIFDQNEESWDSVDITVPLPSLVEYQCYLYNSQFPNAPLHNLTKCKNLRWLEFEISMDGQTSVDLSALLPRSSFPCLRFLAVSSTIDPSNLSMFPVLEILKISYFDPQYRKAFEHLASSGHILQKLVLTNFSQEDLDVNDVELQRALDLMPLLSRVKTRVLKLKYVPLGNEHIEAYLAARPTLLMSLTLAETFATEACLVPILEYVANAKLLRSLKISFLCLDGSEEQPKKRMAVVQNEIAPLGLFDSLSIKLAVYE